MAWPIWRARPMHRKAITEAASAANPRADHLERPGMNGVGEELERDIGNAKQCAGRRGRK